MSDEYAAARHRMVETHLRARGIADERILSAFEAVPRHRFVPAAEQADVYADHPLPIGRGQTISQPFIVAEMIQLLRLREGERVLEIGTGSGYQTALLAEMGCEVFTVERIGALQEHARVVLDELGYGAVRYRVGDGTLGWPEEAPFGAITVGAAGPEVPRALTGQLAEGGRMILPVGGPGLQYLTLVEKRGGRAVERTLSACVFVKLIGEEGWEG